MSKKRGKSIKININLSNRWLYTLILIGVLIAVGVGIYAATYSPSGAGHPYTEISTCSSDGQILKMSGGAWICGSDNTGISTETDPTVKSWAKTDYPTIGSLRVSGTANVSRLGIRDSVLYSIGTPGTYTTIDSCTTLCNNNRPIGVPSTTNMCIYAWNYISSNWQFTTCSDATSARRNCLCVAMFSY